MDKTIAAKTDKILFVKIQNDGFGLGAQRRELATSDLPDALDLIRDFQAAVLHVVDYRGRTPQKTDSGIRLITAKNVRMGYLNYEPVEFIAAEDYDDWMTRGFVEKGGVLITTEAPLGNVAQIDTAEKVALARRIIALLPNNGNLDKTFLKNILITPETQAKIQNNATGSTVYGIKARI